MTRIAWQINRAKLGARKLVGYLVDNLVALAKLFRSPPPELDESHAETRYRMARMTREEWEAYEKAKFDEACEKEAEECQNQKSHYHI
jgi:hypothetical protein